MQLSVHTHVPNINKNVGNGNLFNIQSTGCEQTVLWR